MYVYTCLTLGRGRVTESHQSQCSLASRICPSKLHCIPQVSEHRTNLRKPKVPLTTDLVNKLQVVGKETVAKLADLQAAARASADSKDVHVLEDYTCHTNCIRTGMALKTAGPFCVSCVWQMEFWAKQETVELLLANT